MNDGRSISGLHGQTREYMNMLIDGTINGVPHIGQGLPVEPDFETLRIEKRMIAIENFQRCFAIRPDDRMVMLLDRRLDPRVTHLIIGLARSRGVRPEIIVSDTTQHLFIPDHIKPILERATFVVSTWYCSVLDPYCINLRRDQGQRWVKITFFRNYDLLDTEQGAISRRSYWRSHSRDCVAVSQRRALRS
jgi:hypothetical protein